MFFIAIALLIEFFIQTVFLLLGLWIMVKLQKLNYTFAGLLGSAALASALDLIPFFGTPLAIGALLLCVWKVTESEYVDVAFTVFVGYALTFGMNLWLMGLLMGDMRPSAQMADDKHGGPNPVLTVEARSAKPTDKEDSPDEEGLPDEDRPAEVGRSPRPNPTGVRHLAGPRTSASRGTNLMSQTLAAKEAAPTNAPVPVPLSSLKPAEAVVKYLSVKGITRNAGKSSVAISSSIKTYTLFMGDSVLMEVPGGTLAVRFDELGSDWLTLSVEGEPVKLTLR